MKLRIFAATVFCTLLASSIFAGQVESVLASDSTLWTVAIGAETNSLELTKRFNGVRETLVVPATADEAIESTPRLVWDSSSAMLFVIWNRAEDGLNDTRVAALRTDGTWTAPVVLFGDRSQRAGLQVVMTHKREDATAEEPAADTTFLHAAWWSVGAESVEPQYALIAFEGATHVSTDISTLTAAEELRALTAEDSGEAIHPPLAMVRSNEGVEVVFGEPRSTAVNQIKLTPKRIAGEARLWRPGRSGSGTRTPSAHLTSTNAEPVRAFVTNGRIVLYTPEQQFRFAVYDEGSWTPVRMITLDEGLSSEQMVDELKRTAETGVFTEPAPENE